ncbi:Putative protein [Zobellia galactanivorans]|uniref:Uncharacterized protein n=1 Tax=Zobellia galactanivorans (strain DSM 12802 / CCUG 47099 / CIP 106680 / NCIMB 13871 / Dsij) TaxID=63186 RepID=G0KZG3_ZOBGA|nr:Putative protein [Zobellia galactanivorans]
MKFLEPGISSEAFLFGSGIKSEQHKPTVHEYL